MAADAFPEYLASRLKKGDVICIDEANFLFQQEYSNDFVDLLKTWKDFVARLDEEHHHSIVLSLSTEQYARHRLISYANPVPVEDFTEEEIEKLAELYNYKVTSAQAKILLQKTGGRPFLTGVFIAMLKAHVMTLRSKAAQTEAFDDKLCNISPMREHLTFLKTIVEKEEMATPLKLWLEGKPCHLEKIFGRLQELGILRGMSPNHASITGGIYNHYFRNYL